MFVRRPHYSVAIASPIVPTPATKLGTIDRYVEIRRVGVLDRLKNIWQWSPKHSITLEIADQVTEAEDNGYVPLTSSNLLRGIKPSTVGQTRQVPHTSHLE